MKSYKLMVKGFDGDMNKLLGGRMYDFRCKKYRNPEKAKNDKICCNAIKFSKELKGKKIKKPIVIHYKFYCKDKRKDKMNIFQAFDKSFQDALQLMKVIENDGWSQVYNTTHDFDVDKDNPRVLVEIEEVKTDEPQHEWEWEEL